jgi:hypothetical protein
MVLQEKLRGTNMTNTYSVTTFLMIFSHIRYELAGIDEIVDPSELVRTTLNVFSKPWEIFVRGILVREHIPSWEKLWDDFVQQELRGGSGYSSQQQGGDGDEGDLSLLEKGKKKTKKGPSSNNREEVSSRRI